MDEISQNIIFRIYFVMGMIESDEDTKSIGI